MPDFDPLKLKKDLSRFDARFKKINDTASGKKMIANVKEFANKTNTLNELDVRPSTKYSSAALQTMKLIRMLPDALFSSPDSPLINQKDFLANATPSELNQSLLALYLGAKAMLSGKKNSEQDINYLIQCSFGKDSASISVRDYLLKPFGPDIKIPDFIQDIIRNLEGLVREGNTKAWLEQGRKCGLQKPTTQKLWKGQIIDVLMKDGPCPGNTMIINIDSFKPDSNLQLALPMMRDNYFIVNVEEEINKGNIELLSNADGTVSLSLIIPENISTGDVYFQLASPGGNPECMEFWSVFEGSRPQIKPQGYHISAGKPVIHSFTVSQAGPIFPRQYIDLNWDVENADLLTIEILPVAGSPNADELPQIQITPTLKGSVHVNIVCTRRWKGMYALHASNNNNCGKPALETVLLESGWSEYLIGTGKADITDPTPGLGMMGFADELQKTFEIDMPLFSRAFIIAKNISQPISTDCTAIVVADIWSCTQEVKTEAIRRLNTNASLAGLYNVENVLITGTHTHSGPGGYSHYFLYNLTCGGFDQHNFDIIVNGIVLSILKAHNNLAPGRIYKNTGVVDDCGHNRSIKAYNANIDIADFKDATDKEMLLLKFVKDNDGKGNTYPIGILNWYAIHPTSLGQSNTKVSSDNKGWASHLFEESKKANPSASETFVAAFANSCAGDVSGSVDKSGSTIPHDNATDVINMKALGEKQFKVARDLYDADDAAKDEITGGIAFKYTHIDMSNVTIGNDPSKRTYPAALGLSFGAGSTEDSKANTFLGFLGVNISSGVDEGITTSKLGFTDPATIAIAFGGLAVRLSLNPLPSPQIPWNLPLLSLTIYSPTSLGHAPKPVMFPVGSCTPFPLVPNMVPIQLIKIGQLGIAGVPAEVTTMAGRRLKKSINTAFGNVINKVAIAAYSNAYSSYITTEEEYNEQNYEGASTLYGINTLAAYQQEFSTLAKAIVLGDQINQGIPATVEVVALKQRGFSANQLYVVNRTRKDVSFRIFKFKDNKRKVSFNWPHETVPANENLLFNLTDIGGKHLGSPFQIQIDQTIKIYNVGDPPVIIE